MRSTNINIAKKLEIGINLLIDNILLPPPVILNLFQYLVPKGKILTFVRMTFAVMLNLLQHLCQMVKIPICIGMTYRIVQTCHGASLRKPLNFNF